jgi:hypothetical protein
MEIISCPKCGASIKKEVILKHFRKTHFALTFQSLSEIMKNVDVQINFSEQQWDQERKAAAKRRGKRIDVSPPDFSHIKIREKQKIDHKCFLFQREFDSFNKVLYFEVAEFKFNRLDRIVRSYLMDICENPELPSAIRLDVMNYEKKVVTELKEKLANFKLSTRDKQSFIKEKCETIYITWDDITFERNKIKISPNKAFVQPLEMPGSIKIYNEIKVDYFKRKYSRDMYKLIAHKGIIMDELSKGVYEIRSLISDHAADLERSKGKERIQKEFTDKELTGNQLQETLSKLAIKNEYLSVAARSVSRTDKVFGILENNKGQEEEALLFVYNRVNRKLILWENINPNRAAYLFVLDSNNNAAFNRLKSIIKTNIEYKRYNLFIGTDTKRTFELDCFEYYQLNHFDQFEYSRKLRSILNKYR